MSLLVYTAAYDGQHDQLDLLRHSCDRVGIDLHRYGSGGYPGWAIAKLDHGIEFLKSRTEDIAMWVDGFDSLVLHGQNEIVNRFRELDATAVIAAERSCWPDPKLSSYFPPSLGNEFPNAGGYIGYRDMLIQTLLMVRARTDGENDQEGWCRTFASGMRHVKIDNHSHIFQCMNSPVMNEDPCVRHWNGKSPGRDEFWAQLSRS